MTNFDDNAINQAEVHEYEAKPRHRENVDVLQASYLKMFFVRSVSRAPGVYSLYSLFSMY